LPYWAALLILLCAAILEATGDALMRKGTMPKKPEGWLDQVFPRENKANVQAFPGYAPGVGKTYAMLSEGIRRCGYGEDVVIGVVETHGRKGIEELAAQLEAVPRRQLE
jgi:two-component system, OmpR family, sensor histidine kinase KdpD